VLFQIHESLGLKAVNKRLLAERRYAFDYWSWLAPYTRISASHESYKTILKQ